ncbi:MAG TPA: hypothetical protein VK837_02035 [Longimicrobiales bacterium]|nr:hypothetical protein [Longimicrobiales bacterium]
MHRPTPTPTPTVVASVVLLGGGLAATPLPAQLADNTTTRACEPGALHPDAPLETRQFDFLIGRYEMSLHAWTGDGWSPPRPVGALWEGWYGLDGRVIVDEWFDLDTRNDRPPVRGVNVRIFDPNEELWKMMWIAEPGYQVQDLRAEVRDGVLTMWQVYPDRPGWKAEFEVTDADHWARIAYVQEEEGGAWTPQFRLAASRVPCD